MISCDVHGGLLLLLAACADPAPDPVPAEAADWSLAGCLVDVEERYSDPAYGVETRCRATLFGDEYAYGSWRALSWDCTRADGGWETSRAAWSPEGCQEREAWAVTEPDEVTTSSFEGTCDELGQPLKRQGEYAQEGDFTYSYTYEASYDSEYDASGRLIAQDAEEITSGDFATSQWTTDTWTYEGDRLVQWTRDLEMDASWWAWLARSDYEYDADGRLVARLDTRNTSEGDESFDSRTYRYDALGRLVEDAWDDGDDGSTDGVATYTWVGGSPWVETYAWDRGADGSGDVDYTFSYTCP